MSRFSRFFLPSAFATLAALSVSAVQAAAASTFVAQQHEDRAARDISAPVHQSAAPAKRRPSASQIAAAREAVRNSLSLYNTLTGYLHLQNKDAGKAFTHLLYAARQAPDAKLFLQATEVAIRARAFPSALQALEMWRASFPQDPAANAFHLQLLVASGRIEQSAAALQTALATVDPAKKQQFIHAIPEIYVAARAPLQALETARPALQQAMAQPDTAFIAATSLARMQLAARQYPQALQSLRQATAATPPQEKLGTLPNHELPALVAIDLMGISNAHDKQISRQAQALIQQTMRQHNVSQAFRLAYVRGLELLKDFDEALRQIEHLLQQHPDNALAWATQGALYMELKQWPQAEAALQQYLALRQRQTASGPAPAAPDQDNSMAAVAGNDQGTALFRDLRAYLLLARIADERNDPQKAQEWLDRISPAEAHQNALMQRTEWLLQQKKYDQSLAQVEQAPSSTPEQAIQKALVTAYIYEKQKQVSKGITVLNEALQAAPDNPELLYARGNMHEQMGNHTDSERDLRKVIQLHPESPLAYNALGYQLADRNVRLEEARTLIAKALEIEPDNAAIQDSMGWVEYRLGRLEQARALLKQAYETEPQAEIAAHYGEVLWVLGERRQARKIWAEGMKLDAQDQVLQETMQRLNK